MLMDPDYVGGFLCIPKGLPTSAQRVMEGRREGEADKVGEDRDGITADATDNAIH